MANMTFKANLLPNSNLGYSLGSSTQQWAIYGNLIGNANTAIKLSNTPNDITSFLRGDNTWTNVLEGSFWAGIDGDTIAERTIGVRAGAGTLYMYSQASTTGNRGLYIPPHGSGPAKVFISIDANNSVSFDGSFNGNLNGTANYALDSDKLDGYHESSFLRHRATNSVTTNENSLWSQIGIKQYNNCLPDGMPSGVYQWGTQVSLPSGSGRFEFYAAHYGSDSTGLYFRTGWNDDKKAWKKILDNGNYNSYAPTLTGGGASGTWGINVTGSAGSVAWGNVTGKPSTFSPSSHTHTWLELAPGNKVSSTGAAQSDDTGPFTIRWYSATGKIAQQPTQYGFLITCAAGKGSQEMHQMWWEQCDGHIYHRGTNGGNNSSPPAFKMLWQRGDAITGAVWNDYAEYRESHTVLPGYVVQEVGDDTLQLTTQRLDHFAGVTSDTWGFAQGETEKAKTPIAVAGRVLVYPGEDRNKYKPGDCVCAGPNGKVYIMTREEIRDWPDRIVGTVSCVPDYEMWGGGEGADRDPVKVNGRIWIKVK